MNWRPSAHLDVVRERARVYRQIREFFTQRGCLEVDTPSLMPATGTDPNIAPLALLAGGRELYLQSSPEYAMKRLLAAGSGSIFQICHAFRDGERGRLHQGEFAMLEWYRVDYDYRRLMDEIELLVMTLRRNHCEFGRVSYRALFAETLDIDIDVIEPAALRRRTAELLPGTDAEALDVDGCLDLLLALAICPTMRGFQFVYDYPASQAALARRRGDRPDTAERFELFHDGLELVNGFSELTDAVEQRARFEADNARRRALGLPEYPLDERLLAALEAGIEPCAGAALGIDRLLMVLLGLDDIGQALTFRD